MENTAKLDWKTGRLELNGIEVRPGMKSADFRKYGDAVSIMDRRTGRSIITLRDKVYSNGVYGRAKITVDPGRHRIEVIIHPQAGEGIDTLTASKQWLLGVLNEDQFQSFSEPVKAGFSWGYIYATYYSNKDYDRYGGDIEIIYKG